MHVARSADELRVEGPCLVDRYLDGALELDVDALCDGETAWVAAVLEHIEPTGVHSGDSACVLPGPSVLPALEDEIREVAARIAGGLGARGLLNLQLAVTGGKLYVLEANPRASRTVPVRRQGDRRPARRACRQAAPRRAARRARPARAGGALARLGEGGRLPGRALPGRGDAGPEMRSTGEVMAGGATASEAYARALRAAGRSKRGGKIGPPLQATGVS